MSAPSSHTASMNVESGKRATTFSPQSSDPNLDLDNHDCSARQRNSWAESDGNQPNAFATNLPANLQPIRLLIVDQSDQLRQMCCEAAKHFGFVTVEAETMFAARRILE